MTQFYANPLPIYTPAMRLIASIMNANPAVVTTTFANNYIVGTLVRLDIPAYCGMPQADQQVVAVTGILGNTSFSVAMNSVAYFPFAIPDPLPPHANTTAIVVPVGEVNSTLVAATVNTLPF